MFNRICFADLEDASDLEKALALSGSELKGIQFKVEKAQPKAQKAKQNGNVPAKKGKPNQGGEKGKETCAFINVFVIFTLWS